MRLRPILIQATRGPCNGDILPRAPCADPCRFRPPPLRGSVGRRHCRPWHLRHRVEPARRSADSTAYRIVWDRLLQPTRCPLQPLRIGQVPLATAADPQSRFGARESRHVRSESRRRISPAPCRVRYRRASLQGRVCRRAPIHRLSRFRSIPCPRCSTPSHRRPVALDRPRTIRGVFRYPRASPAWMGCPKAKVTTAS